MKKLNMILITACVFLIVNPVFATLAASGNDFEGTPNDSGTTEEKRPSNVTITLLLPDTVSEEQTDEETDEETDEPGEPDGQDEPKLIKVFPVDVTEIREDSEWQIIKTYELRDDENPHDIPQGSFERSGWKFTLTDIIRRETANAEALEFSETVTIDTDTKELEQILQLLTPTMEYRDDNGFVGTLTLDVSSITVETAGTKTSSYTMSVTREYPHLSANDTGLIPKTVTDKGKTYTLASVDWQALRTENIDYVDVPTSYTAKATYTTTGTSTKVTGYTTTAIYNGTLTRLSQDKTFYIAYFFGEEIRTPLEMVTQPNETVEVLPDEPKNELTEEIIPATQGSVETETGEQTATMSKKGIDIWLFIIPCLALVPVGVILLIRKKGIKSTGTPIAILLLLVLSTSIVTPAFAADYHFESGGDTLGGFGKSTAYDDPVKPDPMSENTRKNKDAAMSPPPFGVFSGDIPTDPTSPYHDNQHQSGFASGNQDLPPIGNEGSASDNSSTGSLPSTSQTTTLNTMPWPYADGSIGTLTVTKTKKTIKVYDGETLENMKIGVGHFVSTSAWDGNVGLAGHNRGSAAYFDFVKDLKIGDTLTYTTRYGTRTYEVYHKDKINETDTSPLKWSPENILTLITCVENAPSLRWNVQAREVKQL